MTVPPSPPLLDDPTVQRLRDLAASDAALAADLLDLFDASSREDLARLHAARETVDPLETERAGHRLCGTSASAGTAALQATCRALVDAARRGEVPSEDALNDLDRLLERSRDALRAALLG